MKEIIVIITIAINLFAFILCAADKYKAIKNRYRIPERVLLTVSFFGGALGFLLGMITVRHKTQKPKFTILVPLFLMIHVIIAVYFINKG